MEDKQTFEQSDSEIVDVQHKLISSRRVEGTPVFDVASHKLGSVHSVMIGKRDGRVAYAVLSVGGFFGLGGHVHPIPWELLTYDVDLDGYIVDLTQQQIKDAPTLSLDETDRPIDRAYQEQINRYWGTMPWWGL